MAAISARAWVASNTKSFMESVRLDQMSACEMDELAMAGVTHLIIWDPWVESAFSREYSRTDPVLCKEYVDVLPDIEDSDIIASASAVLTYTLSPDVFTDEKSYTVFRSLLRERDISIVLPVSLALVPPDSLVLQRYPELAYTCESLGINTSDAACIGPQKALVGLTWNGVPTGDTLQLKVYSPLFASAASEIVRSALKYADELLFLDADLMADSVHDSLWGAHNYRLNLSAPEGCQQLECILGRTRTEFNASVCMAHSSSDDDVFLWLLRIGFDLVLDSPVAHRDTAFSRLLRFNDTTEAALSLKAFLLRNLHPQSVVFVETPGTKRALNVFGLYWRDTGAVAYSERRALATAVIMYTLHSSRLYSMDGQWTGLMNTLHPRLVRSFPELASYVVGEFYRVLLECLRTHEFREGLPTPVAVIVASDVQEVAPDPSFIFAYQYNGTDKTTSLVVVNYHDQFATVYVRVALQEVDRVVRATELFSGVTSMHLGSELEVMGLFMVLDPWDFRIYRFN